MEKFLFYGGIVTLGREQGGFSTNPHGTSFDGKRDPSDMSHTHSICDEPRWIKVFSRATYDTSGSICEGSNRSSGFKFQVSFPILPPMTHHWLVKSEPSAYSWADLSKDGRTAWTGVRNFQARNNLRTMKEGDLVLYYHSVTNPAVVGIAKALRTAYPDPTATEGDWSCVDLAPVKPLATPVSLATIKADPSLTEIALIRQSRLSVMPLTQQEYDRITHLGGSKA
jgi:predicted RNA-binding protein with PUA-like domain